MNPGGRGYCLCWTGSKADDGGGGRGGGDEGEGGVQKGRGTEREVRKERKVMQRAGPGPIRQTRSSLLQARVCRVRPMPGTDGRLRLSTMLFRSVVDFSITPPQQARRQVGRQAGSQAGKASSSLCQRLPTSQCRAFAVPLLLFSSFSSSSILFFPPRSAPRCLPASLVRGSLASELLTFHLLELW